MLSWFSANLSTIVISLLLLAVIFLIVRHLIDPASCQWQQLFEKTFDSPAKAGKALLRWQLRCLRRLQKLPQQTLNSENCEGRHPRGFSFPATLALPTQEC